MEERLQKILSAHGVSSRRAAEGYLSAGRVTVNGCTARVGDKADPERDDIRVDGRPLRRPARRTYLMLNKPRGYVTTLSDEKAAHRGGAGAGCGARVWPVGRLI
ncbi:MAG: S4 domain-containing protein [Flavonifractor plautii]